MSAPPLATGASPLAVPRASPGLIAYGTSSITPIIPGLGALSSDGGDPWRWGFAGFSGPCNKQALDWCHKQPLPGFSHPWRWVKCGQLGGTLCGFVYRLAHKQIPVDDPSFAVAKRNVRSGLSKLFLRKNKRAAAIHLWSKVIGFDEPLTRSHAQELGVAWNPKCSELPPGWRKDAPCGGAAGGAGAPGGADVATTASALDPGFEILNGGGILGGVPTWAWYAAAGVGVLVLVVAVQGRRN